MSKIFFHNRERERKLTIVLEKLGNEGERNRERR